MRLVDGLQIECVASEPLVEAPVAMAFDENGRLLVLEMRSYMPDVMGTGEKLPTNRLVVLEDKDADGRFESSSVLVDDLVLPRGVAPSHGGVLLIEPPSLYFCLDADGDGRAEVKRKLADGFLGVENPEHAGNGLVRGVDNWYHLSQHHTEFAFDLASLSARPTPVHGQWGLTMDDAGRFYYTPNSTPLLMDAYPKHLASRSGGAAGIAENIAQPAAATFPVHATTGVNRGYMDGVLRADGTLASLTAACAPVIYRASLLGDAFRDDCFICEPAAQIVKRISLTPGTESHPLPSGRNAYEKSEFLASDDERFRPVNTCVGPDGALYVCDMYRGVIQHKTYLTDYLKAQIKDRDLETPLNMGRIYRITPKGWKPQPLPRLGALQDELLVELLSHADGWYRDTAQRLLVERKAPVAPLVRALLASPAWKTRLHALGTLAGLGALEPSDLARAARDAHPAVAALAFEQWGDLPQAVAVDEALAIAAASSDPSLRAVVASRAFVIAHRGNPAGSPEVARTIAEALPDAISIDALVAAFDDPLVAAADQDLAAVVRHLCEQSAWPSGAGEKRLTQRLAAGLLRRGEASRSLLVELAAEPALSPAARVFLQDQVIGAVKLKDEQPRVLTLAGEPAAWMALSRDDARAELLAQASIYFDWRGRPPINRPRALKELTPDERDRFRKGELLFATCAGCHQGQGQGSPGQAATLAGSAILNGPAERAIKAIVFGLQGEYKVGDAVFKGQMPPTVYPTDEEYASVLTYARRSFGNAGTPVSPAEVAAVRAANAGRVNPFTREELQGR
jgi:mono/diheme cytochrome c family protein/glucose/arabinose dehydrogenase